MKTDALSHSRTRRGDSRGRVSRARVRAVDRALEVIERSRLSASELRILLTVRDGEVSLSDAARALGRQPTQLRRAAARLYARGFLRWRHDAETKVPVFGMTPAGRDLVRPLLSTGTV